MSYSKSKQAAENECFACNTTELLQKRLIALRRREGLTQADVANTLHISRQCYGHFEQVCRTMPPDLIIAIADLYHISTDELLCSTHNQEKKSPVDTGRCKCGQRDSNPHGLPLEPKSSASANSAMSAKSLNNRHK